MQKSFVHPQDMSLPETKSQTLLDAWDFQGRPADRSKTGGWASAAMILCKYNNTHLVRYKLIRNGLELISVSSWMYLTSC